MEKGHGCSARPPWLFRSPAFPTFHFESKNKNGEPPPRRALPGPRPLCGGWGLTPPQGEGRESLEEGCLLLTVLHRPVGCQSWTWDSPGTSCLMKIKPTLCLQWPMAQCLKGLLVTPCLGQCWHQRAQTCPSRAAACFPCPTCCQTVH